MYRQSLDKMRVWMKYYIRLVQLSSFVCEWVDEERVGYYRILWDLIEILRQGNRRT
jgi:hypothetical protein